MPVVGDQQVGRLERRFAFFEQGFDQNVHRLGKKGKTFDFVDVEFVSDITAVLGRVVVRVRVDGEKAFVLQKNVFDVFKSAAIDADVVFCQRTAVAVKRHFES